MNENDIENMSSVFGHSAGVHMSTLLLKLEHSEKSCKSSVKLSGVRIVHMTAPGKRLVSQI